MRSTDQGAGSIGFARSRPAGRGTQTTGVLVVDLYDEPGRSFRVVPQEAWSVENNLSISNMDFEEFADSVDADGVFRGFPPDDVA